MSSIYILPVVVSVTVAYFLTDATSIDIDSATDTSKSRGSGKDEIIDVLASATPVYVVTGTYIVAGAL